MPKSLVPLFGTLCAILAVPAPGFSLDAEFHTYNGFDPVVSGFQRLALIFSDGGYKGLFFSVVIMALILGGLAITVRAATGARANPITWMVPIMVGVILYLSLVIPTGTVHIYDPTTNRYQAVAGIPDGIVAVAGILNLVERGMTEIIATSGDPRSYINQAGGSGFLGLFQATTKVLTSDDTLIDSSINKYLEDCVAFEINRPGATLTVDELRRTATDFSSSFAKADSPAIYTVYYDLAMPQGQTMTCQEAWGNINTYLASPAHLEENLKGICSQLGYDSGDTASYQKCKSDLQATLQDLGVSGMTTDDFMRQAYLSQRLHDVFRSGDTAAVANYKFLTGASGSMKAANEWLPVMKGVLTAIALGLVPFLALFIPTPLFGKALSVMLGFFIWLASWGITDALLHQFLMDYGTKVLEGLPAKGSGLGMDAFYFVPGEMVKVLGMFGTVRMSGLMLATVMTGILVKFGGHALATLAGNLTGQIKTAGQLAANMTEDPSGRASALKSNAWSMPTETIANHPRYGFGPMMDEGMVNQVRGVEGAAAVRRNIGNLQQAGQMPTGMSDMSSLGHYMRRSQMGGAIQTEQGTLSFGGTEGGLVTSALRGGHTTATTLGAGWKLDANAEKDASGNVLAENRSLSSEAVGKIHHLIEQGGQERWRVEAAGMGARFGKAYQELAIEKGAHTLSAGKNWNQHWQALEESRTNSGEARSYQEELSNSIKDSVTQRVANGSAFDQVSKQTRDRLFKAGASIGLNAGALLKNLTLGMLEIKAGVSGEYQMRNSKGQSATFKASEEEISALENTAASIRKEALVKTMNTSAGRAYAASTAAQANAAEGWSHLREAATRDTTSADQNMELMTAYAIDRAQSQYGIVSEQAIMAVLDDMAAARGGSGQEQNALNKDIQGWLAERYKLLDTEKDGNWVLRDQAAIHNRVGQQLGQRRDLGEGAAERAREAVAEISFADPRPGNLNAPTDSVAKKREARRKALESLTDPKGSETNSNPDKPKPGFSLRPEAYDPANSGASLRPGAYDPEKSRSFLQPGTYDAAKPGFSLRPEAYDPAKSGSSLRQVRDNSLQSLKQTQIKKKPNLSNLDMEAFSKLEEKLKELDKY
ncbi:conjugal transfer protein TraG N-terminal domain-containing protein [Syntrophotalea acetylenica]|uniref:TraG N-terminal Proteobacteria domain-containing protein n=1 Tax=Syntrophotalea acetylenica TaxID=29542 RepID=A0A1L3GDG0_SYNAC|nr:conjugal transfer protein TraG N-terminal domain-containing protein [Syntrophotalea acetylenica]APG23980.1 hypothetical protein A7E75_02295 [Syntrophotalea acetylenica]APG44562.1 hypothetical protein A6070_10915 [Syntrophotalea acetylenica]